MSQVLIEFDKDDEADIRNQLAAAAGDISFVEAKRFDGATVLQILALLNAVTIPLIGKIIIARMEANRHVVIKSKGISITGLSADNAVKVLKELSGDD